MEEQNKKLRHAKEKADRGGKKTYTAELFLTGDALIHDSVYQAARQEDGSYDFSRMLACVGKVAEGENLEIECLVLFLDFHNGSRWENEHCPCGKVVGLHVDDYCGIA